MRLSDTKMHQIILANVHRMNHSEFDMTSHFQDGGHVVLPPPTATYIASAGCPLAYQPRDVIGSLYTTVPDPQCIRTCSVSYFYDFTHFCFRHKKTLTQTLRMRKLLSVYLNWWAWHVPTRTCPRSALIREVLPLLTGPAMPTSFPCKHS